MYKILITDKYIKLDSLFNNINKNTGALVSFIGIIKERNNDKKVKSVTYFVLKNLFTTLLEKKCIGLIKNNNISYIYLTQFTGNLHIGGLNSVILVFAKNRNIAFYTCKDLIETLKYELPIWKKEFYLDGSYTWINV